MRDATLVRGNLRSADIHASIDLHGIRRDDFAAHMFGDAHGKLGLPRSRRPDDRQDHA